MKAIAPPVKAEAPDKLQLFGDLNPLVSFASSHNVQ
jgi:hypothetical protein